MIHKLENPLFGEIGRIADQMGVRAYVIGGYVRDWFLCRNLSDIDVVVVGSGIELATELAAQHAVKVCVFKNFGTAMVHLNGCDVEFVGARRESYRADSRKPIVENGTLQDDQCRRDFTINAMAFALNADNFGQMLDPFDGMGDLEAQLIRTPLDPDTTFSDDPLRMMRAVRFATQLDFRIFEPTFASIKRNAHRISIISMERITSELQKIMTSRNPSKGFRLLDQVGLLELILPQLVALKGVETIRGRQHKDNFIHTLKVLDNIVPHTENVWLRWAALLHDIAKARTKAWDDRVGWTFHGHEVLGSKMVRKIFTDLKLPLSDNLKYVQKLVFLHLRPIALTQEIVTDSAVRRLIFEAGNDIDDLMTLCRADITSANDAKVERYMLNFQIVCEKIIEIEEKDRIRNFQPPISGEMIMQFYNIPPSREVGIIKERLKNAILDGDIPNDYHAAYDYMQQVAAELNLHHPI